MASCRISFTSFDDVAGTRLLSILPTVRNESDALAQNRFAILVRTSFVVSRTGRKKGIIVNIPALAAALALMIGSAAQAKVIELVPEAAGVAPPSQARAAGHIAPPRMAALAPSMSELPEPEVFAMMLLGLVLLGFRARRESSEKFE